MQPRSPEAVLGFMAAQRGLGEPGGPNVNWITRACQFVGQPWCLMGVSMAHLAAGFNPTGELLDFGSPSRPPAWAIPGALPHVDGLGMASTYTWGSAYTWAIVANASAAGRWYSDLSAGQPGDTVIVNHNGRGGRRDGNSHGCVLIARQGDGSFLTDNGNVSDSMRLAVWSAGVVEGFARPAYLTSPNPRPPTEEPEVAAFCFSIMPGEDRNICLPVLASRHGYKMVSVSATADEAHCTILIGPEHAARPLAGTTPGGTLSGRTWEPCGDGDSSVYCKVEADSPHPVSVLVEAS